MEQLWPLVVLWILFSVLGGKKKRPPGSGQQATGGGSSLTNKFAAALEELKRAELEARRKQSEMFVPVVFEPKPRASSIAHRAPAAADDESSEDVSTVEGVADYDEDAGRIIEARRQAVAARRQRREERSAEELTPEQLARRGARQDIAIGGKAEHDAWHLEMRATETAQQLRRGSDGADKAARVLRRLADGSARGAVVLSEILGRPRGAS